MLGLLRGSWSAEGREGGGRGTLKACPLPYLALEISICWYTIPDTGSVRQSAQKIWGNRWEKEGERGRGGYE